VSRVLITRAEPEASALADILSRCGHQPVLAPLAQVVANTIYHSTPVPDAIVFTSRTAPGFAQSTQLQSYPVFAIGPRTADAARAAGFQNIIADGDGHYAQLLDHISASPYQNLWHLGGEDVRHDMAADLVRYQIKCTHFPVYTMVAVDDIPAAAKTAIADHALDMALVLSPRTAKRAVALLGEEVRQWLPVWTMSAAIAAPLRAAGWRHTHIASRPSLITLLAEAGLMCDEAITFLKGADDDG
jgi:uroporphyrinogen-III synthase